MESLVRSLKRDGGSQGRKYKECPYFWKAIQKYGWENFEHKILFDGQTHEEACETEVHLIKEKCSSDPEYGYNISRGGCGGDSDQMVKLWQDPEFKKQMCYKMKEAWESADKRERRSLATKERWANEEFKNTTMKKVIESCRRSVMCIDTGEVYNTIKEAADAYGVDRANIVRSCKTHYRCGGCYWKYVDDVS